MMSKSTRARFSRSFECIKALNIHFEEEVKVALNVGKVQLRYLILLNNIFYTYHSEHHSL